MYSLNLLGQNFLNSTIFFKTTGKLKALHIIRNGILILSLMQSLWHLFFYKATSIYTFPQFIVEEAGLFNHLHEAITKSVLKIRKFFWSFNFIFSLKYQALSFFPMQTNRLTPILPQFFLKNFFFLNLYYKPVYVSTLGLLNKPFRKVLVLFLKLLLNFWPCLSSVFAFRRSFFISFTPFLLCPFLNEKIFKIYEV